MVKIKKIGNLHMVVGSTWLTHVSDALFHKTWAGTFGSSLTRFALLAKLIWDTYHVLFTHVCCSNSKSSGSPVFLPLEQLYSHFCSCLNYSGDIWAMKDIPITFHHTTYSFVGCSNPIPMIRQLSWITILSPSWGRFIDPQTWLVWDIDSICPS